MCILFHNTEQNHYSYINLYFHYTNENNIYIIDDNITHKEEKIIWRWINTSTKDMSVVSLCFVFGSVLFSDSSV